MFLVYALSEVTTMKDKIIDLINKVNNEKVLDILYNLIKCYLDEWGIT